MFENISFLILWGFILILSWILLQACGLSLSTPSIPSIIYIRYIVMNYLGIPLLYFYTISHLYNLGVQDRNLILFFWLMSSVCLLLLLFGFLYSRKIFGLDIYQKAVVVKDQKVEYFEVILILFFCLLVFLRYYSIANVVPLVELIKGNVTNPRLLRAEVGLFPGKIWRYNLIFQGVLPFVAYYLFALCLLRKSLVRISLFSITFLLTSFVCLMNFHKAPIGLFFIGLFLVYIFKNQIQISFRNSVLPLIVVLVSMMAGYVFFMGGKIESKLVVRPFRRALGSQIASGYFYLKMFPEDHDFLYGSGMLPNPGSVFPFEPFNIAKRVQYYKKQHLVEGVVRGSSPAVYWASAYANFGILGAIFISFFVGVVIFAIHWLVSRRQLTPLKIGLIVWLAIHLSSIAGTSLSTFVFDIQLVVILFCYAFIKYGPILRGFVFKGYLFSGLKE